jgi:hypothetical protein
MGYSMAGRKLIHEKKPEAEKEEFFYLDNFYLFFVNCFAKEEYKHIYYFATFTNPINSGVPAKKKKQFCTTH